VDHKLGAGFTCSCGRSRWAFALAFRTARGMSPGVFWAMSEVGDDGVAGN